HRQGHPPGRHPRRRRVRQGHRRARLRLFLRRHRRLSRPLGWGVPATMTAQTPALLSWTIGEVSVTAVVESEAVLPSTLLLPAATQAEVDAIGWIAPHYVTETGDLRLAIQALLVRTPTRRIL